MDDDEKQMWKDHKKEVDLMRKKRRAQFHDTVREFQKLGFEVKEMTPFCFRFNDSVDIYPSNKRYHDLTKNVRGDIRGINYTKFLRQFFGLK
jgi:hypothetical protein